MDNWLRSLQSKASQLLITEIDGVFREMGFIGFNSVTGTPIDKSTEWHDSDQNSTLCISYTLPALLDDQMKEKAPLVKVKFQTLGNFLVVCGGLARDGSDLRKMCFHKTRPFASIIRHGDVTGFRRRIKDGLCFPLLIDISEAAGLPGPNCFSTLPNELKLGIMALLPPVSVARLECVCSSLQILSSSCDQLWEAKFYEEYGDAQVAAVAAAAAESSSSVAARRNWRKRFVRRAGKRKLGATDSTEAEGQAKRRSRMELLLAMWQERNPNASPDRVRGMRRHLGRHIGGHPAAN